MKRSRFSEQRVAFALRQVESGKPARDVALRTGVSEAMIYRWKKNYTRLGVN